MPPLLKALKQLKNINKQSIAELKVMMNPPAGVHGCVLAVCVCARACLIVLAVCVHVYMSGACLCVHVCVHVWLFVRMSVCVLCACLCVSMPLIPTI